MVLGAVTAGDEDVGGARLDEVELAWVVALEQHGRAGAEPAPFQPGQRGRHLIDRDALEQRYVHPASPRRPDFAPTTRPAGV
jgi:hypothetical protein